MKVASNQYVPKKAVLETTLACNLRCRHCGSKAGKARSDELTTDEWKTVLTDLAVLGCERVTLSGGEPTMRPDWPILIESAKNAGMRVGMFTNAILFGEDEAREAKDRGLESIAFSLDGLKKVHDTVRGKVGHFECLARAMESARKAKLPFSVVTHINRLNIEQLPDLLTYISNQGAHAWQIQVGTNMGNMKDNPDLLIEPFALIKLEKTLAGLIKTAPKSLRIVPSDSVGYNGPYENVLRNPKKRSPWSGCHAGTHVMGIESNGNVKGCLSIMAGYNQESSAFVEGNVRTESLAQIWNREGGFAYNRNWSIENLGGFCRECIHAPRCRGGCRSKMTASGNGVENPMCVYRVGIENRNIAGNRSGIAAAVMLASMLGAGGTVSCNKVSDHGTDIETDYSAPDTGYDTETDYSDPGTGYDTETEDLDYSDPGTDDLDYSDPGTGYDTETDYSDPGTDAGTGGIDGGN